MQRTGSLVVLASEMNLGQAQRHLEENWQQPHHHHGGFVQPLQTPGVLWRNLGRENARTLLHCLVYMPAQGNRISAEKRWVSQKASLWWWGSFSTDMLPAPSLPYRYFFFNLWFWRERMEICIQSSWQFVYIPWDICLPLSCLFTG